ncbi:hypothetical protein [Haloarcula laminariae]|uniref:hypothetical protein n=1 Tax=Haloarcula laminariae TaxID=2961577 RepID=UPI0021C6ED0B|nr:hypothetical protein [Halomicroarcula laminariae]
MRRRQVLALFGTASLAGCTGMASDGTIKTEQKSPSGESVIVLFDELPAEEQNIVQTAIDENFYHACPELPDAMHSFAERMGSEDTYLTYQGNQYGLWVRIADQVYAMSASPPENTPNCGII